MAKPVSNSAPQPFRPFAASIGQARPGTSPAAAPDPRSGAPPVFRPAATPATPSPAAPPIYRPAARNGLQPKLAPPIYRPGSASPAPMQATPTRSAPPVFRPFTAVQSAPAAASPTFHASAARNTLQPHGLAGVIQCGKPKTKRRRDNLAIDLDGASATAASKRLSHGQRKTEETLHQVVKNAGKRSGTRGYDTARSLAAKMKDDPERFLAEAESLNPPKRIVGGDEIFKGNARSFPQAFRNAFWAHYNAATCVQCAGALTPLNREIDHKIEWSFLKLGIQPTIVCKGGVHWEVITKTQVLEAVCDGDPEDLVGRPIAARTNLQPMCQPCNGRKNGSKNTDSVAPQKVKPNPHKDGCALPEAT